VLIVIAVFSLESILGAFLAGAVIGIVDHRPAARTRGSG
jgi:Kef-type K+ transport system membrane component KefB